MRNMTGTHSWECEQWSTGQPHPLGSYFLKRTKLWEGAWPVAKPVCWLVFVCMRLCFDTLHSLYGICHRESDTKTNNDKCREVFNFCKREQAMYVDTNLTHNGGIYTSEARCRSVNVLLTHCTSVNRSWRRGETGSSAISWYIQRPLKPFNVQSLDGLNQCRGKMLLLLLRVTRPLVLMEPGTRDTSSNLFWRN